MTESFEFLRSLVKERSGIVLGPEKLYLIESRLMPVARSHGCKDVAELQQRMRFHKNENLSTEVVEAMTTNESFFFRDTKPFDQLRKIVLPHLTRQGGGNKHLRIWSAACSSGQEPYSLAICLKEEARQLTGWKCEILATDLAQHVLDKAMKGIYTQFEVQRGVPISLLLKYFTQMPNNAWQVKEDIRTMVRYSVHNLLHDCSSLGQFDIVFCRNVLIYFDEATKAAVLEHIGKVLRPGGVLCLGSAETIIGISQRFKLMDSGQGLYTLAA